MGGTSPGLSPTLYTVMAPLASLSGRRMDMAGVMRESSTRVSTVMVSYPLETEVSVSHSPAYLKLRTVYSFSPQRALPSLHLALVWNALLNRGVCMRRRRS